MNAPALATPQLDLAVERHPHAGTTLTHRRVRWPYVLTTPFRFDAAPADMLTVILQSASGAILAGDRLRQRVDVGSGAALHLTTQAATAVHAMPDGRWAEESMELAATGAFVEYLPEPRILFPEADLRQSLVITVDREATVLAGDGFTLHDPSGRARPFRRLASATVLRRPDGRTLAVDRYDIDGASLDASPWRAHGSLALLCPPDALAAEPTLAALDAAATIAGVYAGASTLPNEAGFWVRIAAHDGEALRSAMRNIWATARRLLTGADPPSRRKGGF